jgi:putative lipoprotein
MKNCIVKIVLTVMTLTTWSAVAMANEPKPDIVSHIMADSNTVVIQSPDMDIRIEYNDKVEVNPDKPKNEGKPRTGKMAGYRIHFYQDNGNSNKAAKSQAYKKAQMVGARFPKYRTHVGYKSPNWRLRVGDFRTRGEAEAAAAELRRAFPAQSREIRVVKDTVTITE